MDSRKTFFIICFILIQSCQSEKTAKRNEASIVPSSDEELVQATPVNDQELDNLKKDESVIKKESPRVEGVDATPVNPVSAADEDAQSDKRERDVPAILDREVVRGSASKTHLATNFDPKQIDETFLITEIENGINTLRKEAGRGKLYPRRNLREAAILQNDFCAEQSALTHDHPDPKFNRVRERVIHFGGRYSIVGENLQYYGLLNRELDGEIFIKPTHYKEVVAGVIDNWVNSEGHYKNFMDEDFKFFGTAIRWNDELTAVFVTQVYGGE